MSRSKFFDVIVKSREPQVNTKITKGGREEKNCNLKFKKRKKYFPYGPPTQSISILSFNSYVLNISKICFWGCFSFTLIEFTIKNKLREVSVNLSKNPQNESCACDCSYLVLISLSLVILTLFYFFFLLGSTFWWLLSSRGGYPTELYIDFTWREKRKNCYEFQKNVWHVWSTGQQDWGSQYITLELFRFYSFTYSLAIFFLSLM